MTPKQKAPIRDWFIRIPWGRYATEILVIFIGITMSFAFEQWKKSRENAEQERQLLVSLRQDLMEKLGELESDSLGYTNIIACTGEIGKYGSLESLTAEQRECFYRVFYQFLYFSHRTPFYETITGNDQWKLLRNKPLQRRVLALFEAHYKVVELQYGVYAEEVNAGKRAFLLANGAFDPARTGVRALKNIPQLTSAKEFPALVYVTRYQANNCMEAIRSALTETRAVLADLNQYLAES